MSESLHIKPEVRRCIEELVALGRGRFDEWDAECAHNALLMFDRAASEVRRLREAEGRAFEEGQNSMMRSLREARAKLYEAELTIAGLREAGERVRRAWEALDEVEPGARWAAAAMRAAVEGLK